MPNIKNFYVAKTARYDEISAISRIYNYLFTDLDEVYLGDNSDEHCPDVYTKDFRKGIEIVTCESQKFYRSHSEYFCAINRDKKYRVTFQNEDIVPLGELNLNKAFIYKTFVPYKDYSNEETEFYERLRLVTHKKLTNLAEGHYDKCKNLALVIFSGYERKPYVNNSKILEIIKDENSQFDRKFDYIYLICNEDILQISKFGEMQSILDDRDIKRVYQKSKLVKNSPEM